MKTIRILTVALAVTLFASCYEDKGNYDYHAINEVTIEGVPERMEIDRLETLTITPQFEGTLYGQDEDRYTYEWQLGKNVISTDKVLNYEVTNSTGSYTLRLSVIDKDNGTRAFAVTNLVVNSSTSSDGILVVSNQNGVADLSYLRLDKENANFSSMFYNRSHEEPLGHNPTFLTQTFVDGCKTYVNKYGGQGIKLVCDEGMMCINNMTLEKNGAIDKQFMLDYGPLYPVPDYSGFKPCYVNSFVSQWRLSPYGSVFNSEYEWVISEDGGLSMISFYRSSAPDIYSANFKQDGDVTYKFSPMISEMGRTPTADRGLNLNAGWDGTYRQFVFDELSGKFFQFDYEDMTEIDADGKSFPGYRAFYGEDTYQSELCFAAISNGSNTKLALFDASQLGTEACKVYDVDAPLMDSSNRFFMLRNIPYVYIVTGDALYRYNVLNVQTGVSPNDGDRLIKLSELGYGNDARIADACMHRGEKKMLLAVSRYGSDTAGNGDELKTDIVEISLEGSKPTLLNKYEGVAGASPKVIYKYRTFARNDERTVD